MLAKLIPIDDIPVRFGRRLPRDYEMAANDKKLAKIAREIDSLDEPVVKWVDDSRTRVSDHDHPAARMPDPLDTLYQEIANMKPWKIWALDPAQQRLADTMQANVEREYTVGFDPAHGGDAAGIAMTRQHADGRVELLSYDQVYEKLKGEAEAPRSASGLSMLMRAEQANTRVREMTDKVEIAQRMQKRAEVRVGPYVKLGGGMYELQGINDQMTYVLSEPTDLEIKEHYKRKALGQQTTNTDAVWEKRLDLRNFLRRVCGYGAEVGPPVGGPTDPVPWTRMKRRGMSYEALKQSLGFGA